MKSSFFNAAILPAPVSAILLRALSLAIVTVETVTVSCAQQSPLELSDPNEMSVEFRHVAKGGSTKKLSIAVADIPNAPGIPVSYRLVENKSYKLVSETIDLGDPVVSFKVPINNEGHFNQVRVLRLVVDEFRPKGFGWRDCTLSLESLRSLAARATRPEHLEYLQAYKEANAKYFPNYSSRRVSCALQERLKPDEYFAIVRQIDPPPSKPFTELKFTFDEGRYTDEKNVTYKITFRNSGPKEIGELSIRSSFDIDTRLISVQPGVGMCVKSNWGSVGGTAVCHLGGLAVGAAVSIDLKGEPTGAKRAVEPNKPNIGWQINAVMAERPNEVIWPVNQFQFHPFLK